MNINNSIILGECSFTGQSGLTVNASGSLSDYKTCVGETDLVSAIDHDDMGAIVPISGRSGGYSKLAAGSAAIGAGSSTHCLTRDQRNNPSFTRTSSACDAGAILYTAASTIYVDSGCTLAQAITSANSNASASGSSCVAGGLDTDRIEVTGNAALSGSLPDITNSLIIDGNGYSILGGGSSSDFRMAQISGSSDDKCAPGGPVCQQLPQYERRGGA